MADVISLHEIANWQLAPETGEIRAALPALQRGFVWKVRQVEELWDSIIRKFPVGAFLLSPYNEKQGKQRFKYEQKYHETNAIASQPTHHLLGGQQRSTAIALGFMDIWSEYRIPILLLPLENLSSEISELQNEESDSVLDAIETMFVRINSGGTRLEGEELMYSLLKASWPEAPNFIDKLQHKLASPSRIAILCARLVLARRRTGFPIIRNVRDFRRLMHDDGFQREIKEFVQKDAVQVFEYAHLYLTKGDFALPAVLAAELAQRSSDVFLLLLCWLDRMQQEKLDANLEVNNHKKMLGFLTAIAWFSKDSTQVVNHLWSSFQKVSGQNLRLFFSKRNFKSTYDLTDSGKYRLIPLVSPDILMDVFERRFLVGSPKYPSIKNKHGKIWVGWDWWHWFFNSLPDTLKNSYKEIDNESWEKHKDTQEDGLLGLYRGAWQTFINTLLSSKNVLLYSQRISINQWFPDFDPSLPDGIEDINRPWDYDHIHPHNYLSGEKRTHKNIPTIIKHWHNSIGNLRVWPMELNRSDNDEIPAVKLKNRDDRCKSIIADDIWHLWEKSTPPTDIRHNYLAHDDFHEQRAALVEAIIRRFVALYDEWYRTLKIGELTR